MRCMIYTQYMIVELSWFWRSLRKAARHDTRDPNRTGTAQRATPPLPPRELSSSANFSSMRVLVLLALVALAAAVNLRLSSATLPRKNLGGTSTVVRSFSFLTLHRSCVRVCVQALAAPFRGRSSVCD